jgi:hypothetical protein
MDAFEAIAGVHIYYRADIALKKEAREGFRWLKKNRQVAEELLDNMEVLKERSVNKVDHTVFWRAYNKLFEEIVLSRYPELTPSHDFYGARCFEFNGKRYLCGDEYDCYPFYLDKELLEERLDDLALELE